mmetsp:Transcript_29194/g.45366  ORF Transcript_29194/g.45366 Transcript_29194/m.45366 type:complete len:805 (-) Transcript_29194:220-2634(-)|eukprot:CAMPEP_0196815934 /NCGR_PEP_ID=MMETSP1362-20130617/52680_1 /TAXON_ID=163516 /ORGANISM="Leptocylindrus danicus, Strain CCMP1856" /LENGTH=804 /DNA_ID=CAMNT_0042193079 /DNA_START=26 /DNA_END=2440 /DNA_ORIENTATION=-
MSSDETKQTPQQQPAVVATAAATNTKSAAAMMRQRVDVLRQIIDDHEQCLSALNRAKRTIRLVQKQLNEPATTAVSFTATTCTPLDSGRFASHRSSNDDDDEEEEEESEKGNNSSIGDEEKVSEEELFNFSQHEHVHVHDDGDGKQLHFQEAEIISDNNCSNNNAYTGPVVDVNQHQDEMLARRLQAEEDKVVTEDVIMDQDDELGADNVSSSSMMMMPPQNITADVGHHQDDMNEVVSVQSTSRLLVDVDADERLARILQAEEDLNDDDHDDDEMDDMAASEDDNVSNEVEEELPVVAIVDDEALPYRTTEMVDQHNADTDEILARALQAEEDLQAEQQEDYCDEDDGESTGNDGDRRDAVHVDIDADEMLARALQAEEDAAEEFSDDDYVEESTSIPDNDVEHHNVVDTAADERLARELQAEEDESDSALCDEEMHEEIGEDVASTDEFEEVKYGGGIENNELSTGEGPVEPAVLNNDKNDDQTNNMKTDEGPHQENLFREEKVIEADELRSLDNVNKEDMKGTTPIQDDSPSSLNDDDKSMAVDDAIAERSADYQPVQSTRSIVDHDQDDLEERITRYFMTQQDEELARRLQAEEEAAVQDDEMQDPPDGDLQYLEEQQFMGDGDDNDIHEPSSEKSLESFSEEGREYAESDLERSYHRGTSGNSINRSDRSPIRRTKSANEARRNGERILPRKHLDAKFASFSAVSTIHEDEVEDKIGNFNRARLSMPSPSIEPVVEEKKPQGLRRGFDSLIRRSKELRRNRDLIKLEKDDRNILRDLWSMQPEEVPEVKRRSYMNLAGT